MINTKRGILSAILAILCIVALALGVSFLMPKAEKINADAIVDGSIVEANGKLVLEQTESTTGDISVNESVGVVSFRENSTTTTHSALAQWFSMKMTVPAYTQYTVSYTLMFSVKVAALGSGTAKVQSQIEINRYDNINGALKGSVGALNLNFDTVNQPQKVPYTINNFVFYNDTGAPKDFKAYFKFEFKTVNKPRAAMFSGSFWWDDYVVEAMGLSAPKTNDTLTCNYDGKPHTLNFVYAEEQVSTDLDGNSVLYNSGYKNVNVTVDAVDGNG
ncbi:MAG: hypothetical protein K2N52_01550, partial [Clostridia bacterium]|nr:hypothetical protein [Clostridia bacterium]